MEEKQGRILAKEVDRFFDLQQKISRLESEARDVLSTARTRAKESNLDFNAADLMKCLELKKLLEEKLQDFIEIHPRRLIDSELFRLYRKDGKLELNKLVKPS